MDSQAVALIPQPWSVVSGGEPFRIEPTTPIVHDAQAEATACWLAQTLGRVSGYPLPLVRTAAQEGPAIRLRIDPQHCDASEGYHLAVDRNGVTITAATSAGLFYGCQTLRQLLPPTAFAPGPVADERWVVSAVTIDDRPRFGWRGLMLDSCRHFFPVPVVLRLIDRMAELKYNRLHWHLTEDQGWRIEIKAYPKLTEVGAWRDDGRGGRYGGYYTQDQLRQVIAYATERHILVIPEIEMPGHSVAAVASYPHLGCRGQAVAVRTEWGISDDIYCAGNEVVSEFMQDVLREVMDVFPGPYIHIGGDEAPKANWRQCPRCQQRMRDEGIEDVEALQIWFTNRIERYLAAHGRVMIGWDEILQPGLAPRAIVQNWRPDWLVDGRNALWRGTEMGYTMIASPVTHCYLDYSHMTTPLEKVADYDPVAGAADASKVIGLEGTLWSERIADEARLEHQAFPRACALAEAAWTDAARRDRSDLLRRMDTQLLRMEAAGIAFFQEPPLQWRDIDKADTPVMLHWPLDALPADADTLEARFELADGGHFLRIHRLDLLCDKQVIATDEHEGLANWRKPTDVTYRLSLPAPIPSGTWQLRAIVTVEGGTRSGGYVFTHFRRGPNG